jgi:hypothetical protein
VRPRGLVSHAWSAITGAFLLFALLKPGAVEAHIDDLAFPTRPATGADALATIHGREIEVVEAMTCRDERRFITSLLGEGVRFGSWPTDTLFAKAAYISDRSYSRGRGSSCQTVEDDLAGWTPVVRQVLGDDALNASEDTLNRSYASLFGPSCQAPFHRVTDTVHRVTDTVVLGTFTPECLIAQIGTVLHQSRLGQWEWDKKTNELLYKNPGTDGLPCISSFRDGNHEGIKGDWDMSVVSYTRLSYFLHEVLDKNWQLALVQLGNDFPVPPGTPAQLPAGFTFQDAMRKLDQFLLTLRGPPNDGTYNLVLTCGNPDNSYGTATDYIDGNDVYDEAQGQEPSSTSEDFAKWLLVLLILLLLLAAAAAAAIAAAAAAGAAAAIAATVVAAVLVAAAAFLFVIFVSPGVEETENHLLMMNSSKYLKNKLMLVELNNSRNTEGFQELKEENEEVRLWLLERLEDIAEDDFVEYNSRPYGHWAMTGLLNLRDFSCEVTLDPIVANPAVGSTSCDQADRDLVTAVDAVLDLHSAKAALGSIEALRIIPFRRLVEENFKYATGKSLTEVGGGADHMIGAMQFWTGDTSHGPNGRASHPSLGVMVWHATSGYRPAEMILDVALDKSTPYEQTITHDGYERYVSGPGWLITAGGDSTRPAQGFTWVVGLTTYFVGVPDNDHGVGVPTTFMSRRGPAHDKYADFLRFDGVHEEWPDDGAKKLISFSDNRCVTENFACGWSLRIPPPVERCLRTASMLYPGLRFIDSAQCKEYSDATPSPTDDFYLAIFRAPCDADEDDCQGGNWGFFEVAPRSAFPSLDAYSKAVIAANASYIDSWAGSHGDEEIKFVQVTQGNRTLEFTPKDEDFGADCRACGGVINHDGGFLNLKGARFTIQHPRGGGRIFLDLDEDEHPVRRGEDGVKLCPSPPPGQPPIGEYCFDVP